MLPMFVADIVFHEDKLTLKLVQFKNIPLMFVTSETFQLEIVESFNEEQSRIISAQFVTPAIMSPGSCTRLAQPLNALWRLAMPMLPKDKHATSLSLLFVVLAPTP
jgi:hypothetical protein